MARIPAAARREQFIDAAVRVIARDGAAGATTRRIAEEANASQTSLHYCFQTKENLLLAVFEHLSESLRVDSEGVNGEEAGLAQTAERLLTRTMQYAVDHLDQTRATFAITMWAQTTNPELAVRMYDMFLAGWQDVLCSAKETASNEEIASVTRMVVTLADGLSMQLLTDGDRERTMRDTASACVMLSTFVETLLRRSA
ncbi:TetR/AcrR family transcriptional regulator [Streptomyces sp. NPDC048191]|uniref:TetR/AcrR family transcriptional regulator n=1 Tax=Streptomyces sp. NPDC048191 TaxID=3155484 RepID=UPI0033F091B1